MRKPSHRGRGGVWVPSAQGQSRLCPNSCPRRSISRVSWCRLTPLGLRRQRHIVTPHQSLQRRKLKLREDRPRPRHRSSQGSRLRANLLVKEHAPLTGTRPAPPADPPSPACRPRPAAPADPARPRLQTPPSPPVDLSSSRCVFSQAVTQRLGPRSRGVGRGATVPRSSALLLFSRCLTGSEHV